MATEDHAPVEGERSDLEAYRRAGTWLAGAEQATNTRQPLTDSARAHHHDDHDHGGTALGPRRQHPTDTAL